jgi:hypothetical protein
MRQLYSISLAGLFILNTIGGVCLLSLHHLRIRNYVEDFLGDEVPSTVTQLKITKDEANDLLWLEDHHEFIYHGSMYDVVRSEMNDDGSTIYYCMKDDKEKEIYKGMNSVMNHSSPVQHHDCTLVLQFFKILSNVFIPHLNGTITLENETLKRKFFYQDKIQQTTLSIPCEPPDQA